MARPSPVPMVMDELSEDNDGELTDEARKVRLFVGRNLSS